MAAGRGLEPRLEDPNSSVLPLDDPALSNIRDEFVTSNFITPVTKIQPRKALPFCATIKLVMPKTVKHLKLKSPSWVFIDWANVYNWKKSLKREVDSMYGHLGREIFQIKNGIYKISIETLERK